MSVSEGARRLGVTPKAIRGRIERGTIEWRPAGNHGREVLVTPAMEAEPQPGDDPDPLIQIARLEERLASGEREREALREELARSRDKEARLVAKLDEVQQLAELLRSRVEEARLEAARAEARGQSVATGARAEIAAMRQQLETEIAARNAVIEEFKEQLAQARKPWWRRWLGS